MFTFKNRVSKKNIEDVIKEGQKIYSESFLIKRKKNNLNINRFAVVVSKKISKRAIFRNLVKRRFLNSIQNYFKNNSTNIDFFDYVIIVSPKQKDFSYKKVANELESKFNEFNI